MIENYFSYRNGKIVYASRRPNLRWGYKAYNEIQLLDVKSGKQKRITKNTRYFSPDIDEAANRIIVVNVPPSGKPSLHILSASTGEIIRTFSDNRYINYAYPKFYGDTVVTCITDSLGRMSLELINTVNNASEILLPFAYNVIAFPSIRRDTLYFSMSYVKNDELFAMSLENRRLFKVSGVKSSIGKYHATATNGRIAWSTFTSQGLRVQSLRDTDLIFNELHKDAYSKVTSSFGLFHINNINSNLIYRREDSNIPTKKYPQLSHPFGFHSIIPGVDDPLYSLSLIGENILNTVQSEIAISYDRSNRSKSIGGNIAVAQWFPVIAVGLNYYIDRRFLRKDTFVYYNSLEPFAGLYIPLNLSKGRNFTSLTAGSNFVFKQTLYQKRYRKQYDDYGFSYLSNYLSFANQSSSATAQVMPRFGQSIYVNYKFPVSHLAGFQFSGNLKILLPGMAKTHSFNFNIAYSQKDTLRKISFSNNFPFARGYQAINAWKMDGIQVNYQFPIAYPDWGFANLVYFLRLRANVFFDQTHTTLTPAVKRDFRSTGCELFFDTKWWNQATVGFGVRCSRLLDADVYGTRGYNRWEIILPVNIFNK